MEEVVVRVKNEKKMERIRFSKGNIPLENLMRSVTTLIPRLNMLTLSYTISCYFPQHRNSGLANSILQKFHNSIELCVSLIKVVNREQFFSFNNCIKTPYVILERPHINGFTHVNAIKIQNKYSKIRKFYTTFFFSKAAQKEIQTKSEIKKEKSHKGIYRRTRPRRKCSTRIGKDS